MVENTVHCLASLARPLAKCSEQQVLANRFNSGATEEIQAHDTMVVGVLVSREPSQSELAQSVTEGPARLNWRIRRSVLNTKYNIFR